MNYLTALALFALGVRALPIKGRPTNYPNVVFDLQSNPCRIYNEQFLDDIPHECLYYVLCNKPIHDSEGLCFTPGQEPQGSIEYTEFRTLETACQQQAICNMTPDDKNLVSEQGGNVHDVYSVDESLVRDKEGNVHDVYLVDENLVRDKEGNVHDVYSVDESLVRDKEGNVHDVYRYSGVDNTEYNDYDENYYDENYYGDNYYGENYYGENYYGENYYGDNYYGENYYGEN